MSTLLQAKSCNQKALPPNWDGKLLKADHETESIIWTDHEGNQTFIKSNDSKFSEYVCTSMDDYIKIVRIIDSCRSWERFATEEKNLKTLHECFIENK